MCRLHIVAFLGSICLDVGLLGIGCKERTELVPYAIVSVFTEVDATLDDGNVILVDDVATVCNLHDKAATRDVHLLGCAGRRAEEGLDELAVVVAQIAVIDLCRSNPLSLGCLIVALGNGVDGGTSNKSGIDAVSSLGCLLVLAAYGNNTILHRVGLLHLGNVLNHVERILGRVERWAYEGTGSQAVELGCNVGGQRLTAYGHASVSDERARLADGVGAHPLAGPERIPSAPAQGRPCPARWQ